MAETSEINSDNYAPEELPYLQTEFLRRIAGQTETLTVTWGAELFAPVPYNTFTVGPFSITTTVHPGETLEDAFNRAYSFLDAYARKVYLQKRKDFFDRYEGRS